MRKIGRIKVVTFQTCPNVSKGEARKTTLMLSLGLRHNLVIKLKAIGSDSSLTPRAYSAQTPITALDTLGCVGKHWGIESMKRRRFNDGLVFVGRTVIALITVLLLYLSISPAVQANSPAPTKSVWLEFKFPHPDITLDGGQVWKCDRLSCESPVLITADGQCDQSGCLDVPNDVSGFGCEDNRCAWRTIFDSVMLRADEPGEMLYAQFVAQLSDCPPDSSEGNTISTLCQRPVTGPSPPIAIPDLYSHRHWQVSVIDSTLSLEPVPPPLHARYSVTFLLLFSLTVVSEVVTGVTYLSRLHRQSQRQSHTQQPLNSHLKTRILITLGLVHGISYPVAWMIMDSLSPVYWDTARDITIVLVVMAIAFALALYPMRKLALKWFIPALLVIAALLWVVGFMAILILTYGPDTLLFNGLPYLVAVAIAEVFVIVYEASIIAMFSRNTFSFKQALRFSSVTNSVSIFLGAIALQLLSLFSLGR